MRNAESPARRIAPQALRHEEAVRLATLDGPELAAAVVESTWTARRPWFALVFWGPALVCLWFFAVCLLVWGVTGQDVFESGWGTAGVIGWSVIVAVCGGIAVLSVAILQMLFQRTWLRLDTTGLTYRRPWVLTRRPPATYRWDDCGEFAVREVPMTGGEVARSVESTYGDDIFVLDHTFGDPRDLATILNAYRRVYGRRADAGNAVTGRRRDSRTNLGQTVWTSSRGRYVAGAVLAAIPVGTCLFFAVLAESLNPVGRLLVGVGFMLPFACLLAYFLFGAFNPPWVRLDASGIAVGGARHVLPNPAPRRYTWDECGPFTLHCIPDEVDRWVARCTLPRRNPIKRELKFEHYFGDPSELVTILNAYRRAYRIKK